MPSCPGAAPPSGFLVSVWSGLGHSGGGQVGEQGDPEGTGG